MKEHPYNLHYDGNQIIQLLEQLRSAKPEKETIDEIAEKLCLSTSTYKRYLAGESEPLARTLETAYQICQYTNRLLFQLMEDSSVVDANDFLLKLMTSIDKFTRLNEGNIFIVDNLINALLYSDEEQRRHIFSRQGLVEASTALGSLYLKIIKVNLTTEIYEPIYLNQDEWEDLPEEKTYHIRDWFATFVKCDMIHPEDVATFLDKTNIYMLKALMRFTDYDASLAYRRRLGNSYQKVRMEIIKCKDYSPECQNIFIGVRRDFVSALD